MKELFRLLGYAKRYSPLLAISVFLMMIAGAMNGALPLLLKPVIDQVLNPHAPDTRTELGRLPFTTHVLYLDQFIPFPLHNVWSLVAVAILMVFLTKGLTDYCGNYLISVVGFSAVTDLRQKTFEKVVREEHEFFQQHSTGMLMSSIMSDIDKIQLAVSQMLADWIRQSFTALAMLCVLFSRDLRLALIAITVLPFVLLPTARLGKRIRKTTRSAQDNAAELNQILQEAFSGHAVVKGFGAEEYESERFRQAAHRFKRNNLRYIAQQALPSPIIEFFGALTIVALLTYARTQVKSTHMTAGDFTTFIAALLLLYEPVKRLTGITNIFQQAIGAAQRVFEYADRKQAISEVKGAKRLKGLKQSISFEDVWFRYPNTETQSLQGVSLTVRRGEVVALVGSSGAGKTTLANLVPRFYDVEKGSVRIDGIDVRQASLGSLRKLCALVGQETFLFDDTVANNIRYGRPEASDKEIREAARNALAADFIEALPLGYDTRVGERGTMLSGGQRQRLSIARALLKNAPILILDEATSQLDTESELLVQQALGNLMTNRTVIVIAHRLSTIRRADRIVVLDGGKIVETGTHEELLARIGIYDRLYRLQYVDLEHEIMSVRSMTGYAQARRQGVWGDITATVKSVNHRALDLHTYLPLEFESLDPALRQLVRKCISRGHVELRLTYRPSDSNGGPALNRALFDAYLRAVKQASDISGVLADPDPNLALRIPGMLAQNDVTALPAEVEAEAVKASEEALAAVNQFRTREGAETATAMLRHNDLVRQNAEAIRALRGEVSEAIRTRLDERISKLFNGMPLDPQRLAQEVAYLVDRSDISEEVDRLNAHVRELDQLLSNGGELGKKLDFLLQEMNREINTTLSKTSGAGEPGMRITTLGLEIKTNIERIREQALNLE